MNTIFTVKATKAEGEGKNKEYTINLGQDILDGVSESIRDEKATQSIRIDVQGTLRKCDSTVAIQDALIKQGYTDAVVSEGVERTPSVNAEVKALMAILGEDGVRELLEQKRAEKESA